jgi:HK97 family phage prohead protease
VLYRAVADIAVRAAAEDAGTFDGWAVLWDTVDSYGTTFAPTSFTDGGLDSDPYAMLWMHDRDRPIGVFTAESRDRGLWIEGGWDDTTDGRDARARAKSGSAPGLSVGFVPIMVDPDDENRFTQVRLVETSQITRRMAAVPGAELVGARAAAKAPSVLAAAAAARARLALL